jgi:Domain of unknown function (DUF756).
VATVHHESTLPAPVVPEHTESIIPQESGLRKRRPLAYATAVRLEATRRGVRLHMHNPSDLGVVCTAYWDGSHELPHHYTIGAGAKLEDEMLLPKDQKLALTVYGPDSYIRKITVRVHPLCTLIPRALHLEICVWCCTTPELKRYPSK